MKAELPKILLVDDEPRALELLTRSLRKQAQTSTATSAEEALELFAADRFLLVISDQRMPGMSGVDLFGRIAEIDDSTGRILLTGYADLDATIAAINRGRVHAYLHKPCSPPDLLSTVKTVTDRVQLARENRRLRAEIARRDGQSGDAIEKHSAAPSRDTGAVLTDLRRIMCDLAALADGLSARAREENDGALARALDELAADHGGTLEFSKADGGGTSVCLRLPCSRT